MFTIVLASMSGGQTSSDVLSGQWSFGSVPRKPSRAVVHPSQSSSPAGTGQGSKRPHGLAVGVGVGTRTLLLTVSTQSIMADPTWMPVLGVGSSWVCRFTMYGPVGAGSE